MGADAFFGLRRWHRAAEIPFVAPLIVASRPGQPRWRRIESRAAAGLDHRTGAGRRQDRIRRGGPRLRSGESGRRPRTVLPAARPGCGDQRVGNSRGSRPNPHRRRRLDRDGTNLLPPRSPATSARTASIRVQVSGSRGQATHNGSRRFIVWTRPLLDPRLPAGLPLARPESTGYDGDWRNFLFA